MNPEGLPFPKARVMVNSPPKKDPNFKMPKKLLKVCVSHIIPPRDNNLIEKSFRHIKGEEEGGERDFSLEIVI